MIECHLDFESRSPLEPSVVGLRNYIFNGATQLLFLWYRLGDGEYKCVKFYLGERIIKDHPELHAALLDPEVMLVAFNSAFERYSLKKLAYLVPASRFIDPQVGGRYLSLPASLEVQGEVLGLPPSLAKDKRGKELIKLFSEEKIIKAKKATKKNPVGVAEQRYFNDWNSHPVEWNEFLEYGKRDVVAEGELLRRMRLLGAMPLPPLEHALWLLDQKVNDRGMPVDILFVKKMYNLALKAKDEAKLKFENMTGVANANSPAQIKAWAATQGYPYPSLNKDTVASALKDPNLQMSDLLRAALKLRKEAASTSYQKLGKILDAVFPDGRLCGQFIFMGSSRCGRWSGNAVQLHNFARPMLITAPDGKTYDFEDQKVVREARAMVHAEDYDGIMKKYGTVLLVVKNLIRTVFVAPGNEGR
jgi:DNA polymerase bacteriophage-type